LTNNRHIVITKLSPNQTDIANSAQRCIDAGTDGLWIHPVIAKALNGKKRSDLREGYSTGIYISRGVYTIDPKAKQERTLAKKYQQRADQVENAGYQRLATTLRDVADSYNRDAERINSENDVPY
jgi:hypothetical protein